MNPARSPDAYENVRKARGQDGFTLVELLVVLILISVVGLFALSRIHDVSERAYVAAMQNDLRNLTSLQELHADAHGEYAEHPLEITGYGLSAHVDILNYERATSGQWTALYGHQGTDRMICILVRANDYLGRTVCGENGNLGVTRDPDYPGVGETITLTAELNSPPFAVPQGTVVSVRWNLGDGTILEDEEIEIEHAFADEGVYGIVATLILDSGKRAFRAGRVAVQQ